MTHSTSVSMLGQEKDLSRNRGAQHLTERVDGNLLADVAGRRAEDSFFALGISDIDKPSAKNMENLALVRDGSTAGLSSNGYPLLEVLGGDVEGFLKRQLRFAVRLVGKRNFILKDGTRERALKTNRGDTSDFQLCFDFW